MSETPGALRTVGVRLRGESTVTYCVWPADLPVPAAGDAIVVTRDDREQTGRVVIASDQVIRADFLAGLPVALRLARDEDLDFSTDDLPTGPLAVDDGQQIGGPGPMLRMTTVVHEHSVEDLRFRALKAQFPAIGARVHIPEGAGIVVAVNASRSTVDIRLDGDAGIHTIGAAMILAES